MGRKLSKFEKTIVRDLEEREKRILSEYATFSKDGLRRYKEKFPNIRPSFSRDADRILHSFAFTRCIDKTQVFSLQEHDFISHRVVHVQLVSKIGRTIARALRLNEDLVEAISLGHDIGHPPFGHEGEENLTKEITQKLGKNMFYFRHSIQGVRFLTELEDGGYLGNSRKGLNLTLQVLDGILCHDGETLLQTIRPKRNKTWQDFDKEIKMKKEKKKIELKPMTLEGCLVRFVDVIAYIGRDIEDAKAIGLIRWKDIPDELRKPNRKIVNMFAMNIIKNSQNKDLIAYSDKAFDKLQRFWKFNYDYIYKNPLIKTERDKIKDMFTTFYYRLLDDVQKENRSSPIFKDHIDLIDKGDRKKSYFSNTPPEIVVVDYIAGMTDNYFINTYNEIFYPRKLPFNFRQIERMTGLPKDHLLRLLR